MEIIRKFIGYLAAFCTTTSFLPQFILVYKTRSVKDISFEMYVVFCLGLVLWIIYGIMNKELPIILANSCTFILAFGILIIKVQQDYKEIQTKISKSLASLKSNF
jgi:MtN3 and saliva related transmembrane protein